jgi:hypothetical protein
MSMAMHVARCSGGVRVTGCDGALTVGSAAPGDDDEGRG